MKIGIVGHGFVGKAVDYGFSHPHVTKTIVDPKYGTDIDNSGILDSNIIFICVPTPFGDNGSVDASIVNNVLEHLIRGYRYGGIIVVKSTVPPDIVAGWTKYDLYHDWQPHNNIVYNPEFLTEKSANEQFVNPEFHIIGGMGKPVDEVESIYDTYSLCSPCPVFKMTAVEASFVKYAINTFLATKVTFFNQLYDAVNDAGANFATIIKAVGADPRIGPSHTKVPGFDGKQGFGGACFPKDTNAFANHTNHLTLLKEVIKINNAYRLQYDLDEREKEQNVNYGQTQEEQ